MSGGSGLKAVYLARRSLIERLVRARTGDPCEAEDVLQELWLKIERMRTGPIHDPLSYLMKAALNLCVDRSTSSRRRAERERGWLDVQPADREMPSLEDGICAQRELADVQKSLNEMPGHMAQALIMFRLEGLTQREIAGRLGMSVSGIEKLLARGLRQLVEKQRELASFDAADTVVPLWRKSDVC